MAQRIAEQLDPGKVRRQGVLPDRQHQERDRRPESDIDLLLHFEGTEDQRKDLMLWLEGWSRCLAK